MSRLKRKHHSGGIGERDPGFRSFKESLTRGQGEKARESIEVGESTRVVLGDIEQKEKVVRCSLDSCLLLSP